VLHTLQSRQIRFNVDLLKQSFVSAQFNKMNTTMQRVQRAQRSVSSDGKQDKGVTILSMRYGVECA
jgi:hypothetical protein